MKTQAIKTVAHAQQKQFERTTRPERRKEIGHFGTPAEIAEFMAGMFSAIPVGTVRLLDAGAGVGTLSAAVCERIAALDEPRTVDVTLYETEQSLHPLLKETMAVVRTYLEQRGHRLTYTIHGDDFILAHDRQADLFAGDSPRESFDLVIMNPPYFKIARDSAWALAMPHVVHGQPNIYALFMALGAELLKPAGEMVAITPRSYCSGLYFREFRRYFFDTVTPYHIHIFESRKKAFSDSGVLQENIILAARKDKAITTVRFTISDGRDLVNLQMRETPLETVIDTTNGDNILRIISGNQEQQILELVEALPRRFQEAGYAISTGPVVTFRAKEFLLSDGNRSDAVPFISMHNVRPFRTLWPIERRGKVTHFQACATSQQLLLPPKDYILLKRFTAKEEKRRTVAGVLLAADFPVSQIAIENHLNYLHRPKENMSPDELFGLAALLNSALIDCYFRQINGNTQVNASEIRMLPLPERGVIGAIGAEVLAGGCEDLVRVEAIILKHLGITGETATFLLEKA